MIDPNLPLELDDGTPVTLVRNSHNGGFSVKHNSSPVRPQFRRDIDPWSQASNHSWYYDKDGVFGGGDAKKMFVLRNVVSTGPEEYEEWFK